MTARDQQGDSAWTPPGRLCDLWWPPHVPQQCAADICDLQAPPGSNTTVEAMSRCCVLDPSVLQ